MMDWGYGWGMGGFGIVFTILIWALLILGLVVLIKLVAGGGAEKGGSKAEDSALEILKSATPGARLTGRSSRKKKSRICSPEEARGGGMVPGPRQAPRIPDPSRPEPGAGCCRPGPERLRQRSPYARGGISSSRSLCRRERLRGKKGHAVLQPFPPAVGHHGLFDLLQRDHVGTARTANRSRPRSKSTSSMPASPDRAARMPSGHPVQRMPPLRDIPSTRKSKVSRA